MISTQVYYLPPPFVIKQPHLLLLCPHSTTELPAYSDTLWTKIECHSKQDVTVGGGFYTVIIDLGPAQCHCKGVFTVTGFTVSSDVCNRMDIIDGSPLDWGTVC